MKPRPLLMALLLALPIAACSDANTGGAAHVDGNLQHIVFDDAGLVINAPGKPNAHIGANGDLRIGATPVAVNPMQRGLLVRYYGEAMAVRDDGIATGKAGAALGAHAIGSVVGNLFAGTPDKIGRDMDARGKTVEATATHLCGDLVQLKSTQSDLAAQLPAFRPYQDFVARCIATPRPRTER